jgi:predicted kinase
MYRLILLRGVSGSGKTSFADYIAAISSRSSVVCSADDYHMVDGEYVFNPANLRAAHAACQNKADAAMERHCETVIVANTSTREKDVEWYHSLACLHGYKFVSLIVENRHKSSNVHNVPAEALAKQKDQLTNSIKL